MQIAQNIKKLREEKGLLQKEIAITIGIHPSNYSKMEKGEREFNIEVLDKLAKFFNLSIDELVHSCLVSQGCCSNLPLLYGA
jgi:transcriptional regulator with XRE-family HTH domain